jgi:hypothetical protein
MTLAESEDSPLQARAMAVVNRARLAVAKAHFRARHGGPTPPRTAAAAAARGCGAEVCLDAWQGEFPEDFSHRNRVLIGSVVRAPNV